MSRVHFTKWWRKIWWSGRIGWTLWKGIIITVNGKFSEFLEIVLYALPKLTPIHQNVQVECILTKIPLSWILIQAPLSKIEMMLMMTMIWCWWSDVHDDNDLVLMMTMLMTEIWCWWWQWWWQWSDVDDDNGTKGKMTVWDSLRLEASLYELMLSLRNVAVYQTFQMVASHTVQNYIIHYTVYSTNHRRRLRKSRLPRNSCKAWLCISMYIIMWCRIYIYWVVLTLAALVIKLNNIFVFPWGVFSKSWVLC